MVDYSNYSIFILLNILWDNWEQIHALDALIQIDTIHLYERQRQNCYEVVKEVRDALREKWFPQLPPLLPLLLRYQNIKTIYSSKLHDRRSYLRLLNRKRLYLERHQRLIDEHEHRRSTRRRRTLVVNTTRAFLRQ